MNYSPDFYRGASVEFMRPFSVSGCFPTLKWSVVTFRKRRIENGKHPPGRNPRSATREPSGSYPFCDHGAGSGRPRRHPPQPLRPNIPIRTRFGPVDAVRELLAGRNARVATMREADAGTRVEAALREGHITPAMRGWTAALSMQDPPSFDSYIAKLPPNAQHLRPTRRGTGRAGASGPGRLGRDDNGCNQLGIGTGKLAS